MKKHFMIDIETTGVDKINDSILEVGLVEIVYRDGFWHLGGREFRSVLKYHGSPQTAFAKKHMAALYEECNSADRRLTPSYVGDQVRRFIHQGDYGDDYLDPKFFMGWNASGFDMPFMFAKGMLTPSYYVPDPNDLESDILVGDAHYRVYEQTGALNMVVDATGFSRKTVQQLAFELNPTGIELPKGKEHDALYDCYSQIIMMNGLIELSRRGYRK